MWGGGVGVEVVEVVKGHQVSLPVLPKEGLLRDRLSVSWWLNESEPLHHGLFVFVAKTRQPLFQLQTATTHTHTDSTGKAWRHLEKEDFSWLFLCLFKNESWKWKKPCLLWCFAHFELLCLIIFQLFAHILFHLDANQHGL